MQSSEWVLSTADKTRSLKESVKRGKPSYCGHHSDRKDWSFEKE